MHEMSSTCELMFRIIAAMGLYPEMGYGLPSFEDTLEGEARLN